MRMSKLLFVGSYLQYVPLANQNDGKNNMNDKSSYMTRFCSLSLRYLSISIYLLFL
jgi:hypothetical protein